MRYPAEETARRHQQIVAAASRLFRERGFEGVSVAELMAAAGLTHGGFYAHFASKEDLVNAAVGQMFAEGQARLGQSLKADTPRQALSDYLDFYLSKAHRDTRTAGCPLPFLAADAPRMDDAFRAQYAGGVARLTARLAEPLAALGHPDAVETAGSILAEMVGALALARAEPDVARSDAILERSLRAVRRRAGLDTPA